MAMDAAPRTGDKTQDTQDTINGTHETGHVKQGIEQWAPTGTKHMTNCDLSLSNASPRSWLLKFEVFASFLGVLALARTCSDLFGCIRMRSDAFGCIWMRSDAFGHFRKISKKMLTNNLFFEVFGLARTCSDLFGCVRMRSDASGCVWMRSYTFGKVRCFFHENFGIFALF